MAPLLEIVSKEKIFPSCPTPNQFREHKLFLIDQVQSPIFIPLILFYEPDLKCQITPDQKSRQLKHFLSQTLTYFYPVAGRKTHENPLSIDCNDAGVEFIVANVSAQLSDVIQEPSMEEVHQYFPKPPHEMCSDALLAVQVNFFACGGLAIAACLSHQIGDCASFTTLLSAWAATCRDADAEVIKPSFGLGAIPPLDFSAFDIGFSSIPVPRGKIVTKRVVFDKKMLEKLKEDIASGQQVNNPTRVEAVTYFIYKHFIAKAKAEAASESSNKIFSIAQAVNLRPRVKPPIPEHGFGNLSIFVTAVVTPEVEKNVVISSLREAISDHNSDYFFKIQKDEECRLGSLKRIVDVYMNKDVEVFSCSSWSRFPFYELDFGWGKPIWVSPGTFHFKNLAILVSTRCGEGIEAFINTLEDDVLLIPTQL